MEMDPGEGERDNRREKIQWEQRKMQYKGEKDGNYHTGVSVRIHTHLTFC